MIGQTISHYKILEKVGEGGMGEVYLAWDTNLERKLALKFLPPHLISDPDAKLRFKREAQAAAKLEHSNIITIYEAADFEDRCYIAMEYVKGESLKHWIEKKALNLDRILDITIQICEGLKNAHQEGIVHRDIKSENILIDKDCQVKILDFGLAKLKNVSKLTQGGETYGTVSYMSPEQLQGEEVDQRTDIFSLGVVLYEMITKTLPFEGAHTPAVIYSILNETPLPLTRFNSQTPSKLQEIVAKALVKEKEGRYQAIEDLLEDLKTLKKDLEEGKTEAPKKQKKSVAVLYFENLSSEPESDYFSAGITEDIMTDLSKIDSLQVASRNAVLRYKGKAVDIPLLGRKLNLDAVLEGSVRKAGNRLRISAQLIDTRGGFQLWAERYDRELRDIFELQEEIAKKIASALKIRLSEKEEGKIARKYKGNLEAYDYYLKGRNYYYKYTKQDLLAAIQMFKNALEIDSHYALAYAGLADSYTQMIDKGYETDKLFLKKAEEEALQAVSIDPLCTEAYKALGTTYLRLGRLHSSKDNLLKALELNPNHVPARGNLGHVYRILGNFEQAEKELLFAYEQDPSMTNTIFVIAYFYLRLNNFSKAKEYANKLLEVGESSFYISAGHYTLSKIYFFQRQFEKALEHMQKFMELEPHDPFGISGLASIYAALGKKEEALANIAKTLNNVLWHEYFIENIILTYALLKNKSKVYEWIKKGMEQNTIYLVFLEYNPLLEDIRKEPEFQKLLQEIKNKVLHSE